MTNAFAFAKIQACVYHLNFVLSLKHILGQKLLFVPTQENIQMLL